MKISLTPRQRDDFAAILPMVFAKAVAFFGRPLTFEEIEVLTRATFDWAATPAASH